MVFLSLLDKLNLYATFHQKLTNQSEVHLLPNFFLCILFSDWLVLTHILALPALLNVEPIFEIL